MFAIIDEADGPIVAGRNWYANEVGGGFVYAASYEGRRRVYLHQFLWSAWGLSPSPVIDHRDTDTLNDRRENLRAATHSQNHANSPIGARNTSGFKGVYRYRDGRWAAMITIDSKRRFLGYFEKAEDAGETYLAAAREHFGEFARAA